MCGILGYIGNENYSAEKVAVLFDENMSRGRMATGYFSGVRNLINKHNCDAVAFMKLFGLPATETLFLGHTRQATQGKNTPKNAHPFRIKNIVGIHNGIIYNDDKLAKEYDFKHVVDSEAIFQMIEKKGFDGLKEVHGCIAVAWSDRRKPDTLFLYRRDNPIFIGYVGSAMYFSSLEHSLKKIGCERIESLKTDTVFEFVGGKLANSTDIPYTRNNTYGYRNWDDYDDYYGGFRGNRDYTNKDREYVGASPVFNPQTRVWEYPVKQIAAAAKKDDYQPETLASRKAKLNKEFQVESGKTANALTGSRVGKQLSIVKGKTEVSDTTVDDKGNMEGGRQPIGTIVSEDALFNEMVDMLKDCYYFVSNYAGYDAEAYDLAVKIRKMLY